MSNAPYPVMLFGKLPTQGDFVRANMGRGVGPEIEHWLGRSVEESHGRIPEAPVHLLARLGPDHRLMAGAWVPSRDSVGRAFPFAIFRDIEEELSVAPVSILPMFLEPWFEGIEALARSAAAEGASATASNAAALDLGHLSAIPGAVYKSATLLSQHSVSELAVSFYGEYAALEQLGYALLCIEKAVQQRQDTAGKPIVLDAPCKSEEHVVMWLELLRCAQKSAALPCCVVTQRSPRRLLISLGGLSEMLLAFLVTPEHPSPERWPLWSTRSDARSRAAERLTHPVAQVLHHNGSTANLLAALQA